MTVSEQHCSDYSVISWNLEALNTFVSTIEKDKNMQQFQVEKYSFAT